MAFSVETSIRLEKAGIPPKYLMRAINVAERERKKQDLNTIRNGVHSLNFIFKPALVDMLTAKTTSAGGKIRTKVIPSLFQTRVSTQRVTYIPGDRQAASEWLNSQPIGSFFTYEEIKDLSFISRYEKRESGWYLVFTKYKKLPQPLWTEYITRVFQLINKAGHMDLIYQAMKEHYTE